MVSVHLGGEKDKSNNSLIRCYDKRYIQVKPIPSLYPQEDMAKRFFEYNNGVHLSEGTAQKIYYNTNHEECGDLCIKSTLQPLNVRCLSFDFYEFPSFDLPAEQPPPNRGICVLNSGNKDDARLRNVDQGYTDEELFSDPSIAGHYRFRLSNFGGHYNVRNPRGGQLADQLDYPVTSPNDLNKIYVWGGSRWGIAHLPPWENGTVTVTPSSRQALARQVNCSLVARDTPPSWDNTTQLTYYGGYTPVNNNQKCVGLLTKQDAANACLNSGGQLCPNQQVVKSLEGRKIGCSYDGDPVWSAADVPISLNQTKFVRCCAKYSYPNFCAAQYSQSNINFCSQFKTFHQCQYQGTGYNRQSNWGFGRLLKSYRNACIGSNYNPNQCMKTMVQDWAPRDQCIWCLEPGTGQGECRAGSDFGVCKSSNAITKNRFAEIANVMCGKEATCRLSKAYPDMACFLLGTCGVNGDGTVDPNVVACANYDYNQAQCGQYPDQCVWVPSSQRCLAIDSIGGD